MGNTISIHAPRTGSDRNSIHPRWALCYFNPRSPHGERQSAPASPGKTSPYFNPRSPHGERLNSMRNMEQESGISIHAPRTGSDQGRRCRTRHPDISIHAPRTGSDLPHPRHTKLHPHFNPRSPHGERRACPFCRACCSDFNPRSPHGERLRKVTILSIRIIGFAQKVYHKTVLLRISLAENAVILPEKPRNPVRTSLQKAGGLRFARAIRAARPYSISSPSGA